jgi:hypothetical protein
MPETAVHAALAGWANFYLITGSAAAALTGLQFIVHTLLASDTHLRVEGDDPEGGIAAFGTPTVVHFGLALLVSALLCVPWPSYTGLRGMLGVIGAGALVYTAVVFRRARRQHSYVPTAYDWTWYLLVPAAAHAAVVLAAVLLGRGDGALFAVAAATLIWLCAGIHNAWDTVTYLTIAALRRR